MLQSNGRLSFTEIGKIVGLSAPAVADRIIKMEEAGIIRGYRAVLELEKLGLPVKAIISFKAYSGKLESFLTLIRSKQEIQECHRVTGEHCLILKVAVATTKELEKIIDLFIGYGEPTTSMILSSPTENVNITKPQEHLV